MYVLCCIQVMELQCQYCQPPTLEEAEKGSVLMVADAASREKDRLAMETDMQARTALMVSCT